MSAKTLKDAVARLLAGDSEFLAFKGLTTESDNEAKAQYIIKSREADKTADNVPLCQVYILSGNKDRSSPQFYNGKLVFDCHAKTLDTAERMAQRIMALMRNWSPPGMVATDVSFAAETEIPTEKQGLKGHRVYYDVPYLI